MPTYQYKNTKGKLVELFMTIREMEYSEFTVKDQRYIMHNGKRLKRLYGCQGNGTTANWPMESWNAGIHPSQIAEQTVRDRAAGIPTEYNHKTGDVILTDRNHRKRYLKHRGLRDRDAGYSD